MLRYHFLKCFKYLLCLLWLALVESIHGVYDTWKYIAQRDENLIDNLFKLGIVPFWAIESLNIRYYPWRSLVSGHIKVTEDLFDITSKQMNRL